MIKVISTFFQIILILFLVLFIVNNSFLVSFEIGDFIYSLSSSYIFGFLLLSFIIIFFIQSLYFKITNRMRKYQTNKLIKKEKIGYEYFTKGMVALASKDYKNAAIFSLKLNKFLKNDKSLFMLLHSEVLKRTKNFDQLKITYDQMINNETTKELGEIGLMEYYLNTQDFHHAFIYAERLFLKNPNVDKLYSNILQIISKTNNWSQLLQLSKKAYENKLISKNIFFEHKSIALYEIAQIKHSSNISESIKLMKEAIGLRKSFTPYIKFLTNLLIKNNNISEAKKLLTKSWNENPNSELRKFIVFISSELELDIIKFVSSFSSIGSKNEQSQLLLTQAYIASKKWTDAREHIKTIMTANPSREICELMAIIELGENSDIAKSNSWKMRGENGSLENCWICTISNQTQKEWSSVSLSGYFNSLAWKQIPMLYQQSLEKIKSEN